MKRKISVKTVLVGLAAVLSVYSLLGFLVVPKLAKRAIRSSVETALDSAFQLESFRFNPYTLEARINNLSVSSKDGKPVFSLGNGYLNLSCSSLFKFAPVITGLMLDRPKLSLTVGRDGKLILPGKQKEGDEPEPSGGLFKFRLSNFGIQDGEVELTDLSTSVTHKIQKLTVNLPLISTLEGEREDPVTARAELSLNRAPITLTLVSHPFASKMDVKATVTGSRAELATYLPYVPLPEGLTLTSPGNLSWDLVLGVTKGTSGSVPDISVRGSLRLASVTADLKGRGKLAEVPGLDVTIDAPNLLKEKIRINSIRLDSPRIFLARDRSGSFPLLGVLGGSDKTVQEKAATTGQADHAKPDETGPERVSQGKRDRPSPGFGLILDEAVLADGQVRFTDEDVDGGFETLLSEISVQVKNAKVSDENISMNLTGRFTSSAGEMLELEGRIERKGAVTGASGKISLKNGNPSAYAAYLKPYGVISIKEVDAATAFSVNLDPDGKPTGGISNGRIALSDIRILDPANHDPIMEIPETTVEGGEVDLESRRIRIASARVAGGTGDLRIAKSGELNLVKAISGMIPSKATEKDEVTPVEAAPWQVMVDQLALSGWNLALEDNSRNGGTAHIGLSDITVTAEHLNTHGEAGTVKGSLIWEKSGKIAFDGDLDLAAVNAKLKVILSDIGIEPFEAYINDYLNLNIQDGAVHAKGDLNLSFKDGLSVRYRGSAGLSDFSSTDKISGHDFVKGKSLFLSGMDLSLFPIRVDIEKVALTDFYTRAVLLASGKTNFSLLTAGKSKAVPTEESVSAGPIPPVTIHSITLQGGQVNFTDLFTQPNYTANMTELAGSVANLSTQGTTPAQITLKGLHGRYSPLDIKGRINPFAKERSADVSLSFKNIELTELNSYARKYLGYGIETGKLMLNLDYTIRGNALSSSNQILFDQLALGNSVKNTGAPSLPIPLAISLLTDEKGVIDLNIPVNGNLDDPKFRFGRVIGLAIKNMIMDVVSAPFKFLGKVLGGWDSGELGFVAFAPGRSVLNAESLAKLEQLVDILSKKNKLNLTIQGKFDPDVDSDALRTKRYETTLVALAKNSGYTDPEKTIEDPIKRVHLVETAYAKAEFPKPKDETGLEKKIGTSDMETLLLTHTAVTEEELKTLAEQRSTVIREQMLASKKMTPERLFIQAASPVEKNDSSVLSVKSRFKIH